MNEGLQIDRLLPSVYASLRAIAATYLERESGYQTLQPTALVHEAYVRLARRNDIDWHGRTHFLALAATEMRRVLVEHARSAGARKRGSGLRPEPIDHADGVVPCVGVAGIALEQALSNLGSRSPRQARVAEMRIFSGMLNREIAETLGVCERTVKGDWHMARAWLARELRAADA